MARAGLGSRPGAALWRACPARTPGRAARCTGGVDVAWRLPISSSNGSPRTRCCCVLASASTRRSMRACRSRSMFCSTGCRHWNACRPMPACCCDSTRWPGAMPIPPTRTRHWSAWFAPHSMRARLRRGRPAIRRSRCAMAASTGRIWPDADSADPHQALERVVRAALDAGEAPPRPPRDQEIPVCYGGVHGPDLAEVAQRLDLPIEDIVVRHVAADYRVAMIGFAPGFPYLLGLDPALTMPRRADPRQRVPAGSVAIGGAQTGIYPAELPGGWQLIGRTPRRLFDVARTPPSLLAAGDRVRFRSISEEEFRRLDAEQNR